MTTTEPTVAPLSVSRFEAALLRMLRAFLRPSPGEPPMLPAGKLTPPKGLSPACIHLVQDTLAKGCVQFLAKAGGWRREKHLRAGQPSLGRLWERTPVEQLGFSFSPHTISFLMWLAAGRPEKTHAWDPAESELTPADQFLCFLAYSGLRGTEAALALRTRSPFVQHGLIRLFFPEDFAGLTVQPALDFATWVEGLGGCILEALQQRLQQRWLELERGKNQIGDWPKLRQLGLAQEQSLRAFLGEAEAARRPDLARFLLRALAELLSPDLTPAFWIGGLQDNGPPRLADRLETQRQGVAVLRQVECLGDWARRARGTGFLDENYAVAQQWLADWEQYRGDELVTIAGNLLRQLEPLRIQATPTAGIAARVPTQETTRQ